MSHKSDMEHGTSQEGCSHSAFCDNDFTADSTFLPSPSPTSSVELSEAAIQLFATLNLFVEQIPVLLPYHPPSVNNGQTLYIRNCSFLI